MERDLSPVVGEVEAGDRIIARRDPRFGAALRVHFPEVRLLVVLVIRIHVVLDLVARFFLVRPGLGRHEQEGGAVRRPLDVLVDRAAVPGQWPRLAAFNRQEINLRELVVAALGRERDGAAVRRPARRVLVLASIGQLHRRTTPVGARPPDTRQALAALPVGVAPREHDVSPVGRELRIAETRHTQQINDAQRARRLRRERHERQVCGHGDREEQADPAEAHRHRPLHCKQCLNRSVVAGLTVAAAASRRARPSGV
jgi:hypothetical protein